MRIFVSGGTGVIGWRVVRDLVAAGHEVTAVARSDDKARLVEGLGARPVRVGLFDPEGLRAAVAGHDVVVNLATSIPPVSRMLSASAWRTNDRIRSEGSRNLVDAALAGGAGRFIQESITFLYADGGSEWIDEDSPVEASAVLASALDAEANVARFTAAGGTGVVLRFGAFYGPDSAHMRLLLFAAKLGLDILPGRAGDYVSVIETDDAAAAVVAALGARAGTYNVVDDTPLRHSDYDRALADAVGARKVRRPAALTGMVVRSARHLARSHRVSNRRLRAETGWAPRYSSVGEGLPASIEGTGVGPLPAGSGRIRLLLGFLAAGALLVGGWAQFAPRSFYDSFPGAGRAWVSLDGPFNEHLVRDVGGLNLALAGLAVVAAVAMTPALVRTTGLAWLLYGVPHAVYHAAHLAPLAPGDRVATMVALGAGVAAALVLVRRSPWVPARRAGRAAAPGRGLDPRFQASKARVLPIGRPRKGPAA